MNTLEDFSVTSIAPFVATGMRRCVIPGAGCKNAGGNFGSSSSQADFWHGQNGTTLMRVSCAGYRWSFKAQRRSGQPIPNDLESMESFSEFVMQELHRWMAEDAADLPPFEDYETEPSQETSEESFK